MVVWRRCEKLLRATCLTNNGVTMGGAASALGLAPGKVGKIKHRFCSEDFLHLTAAQQKAVDEQNPTQKKLQAMKVRACPPTSIATITHPHSLTCVHTHTTHAHTHTRTYTHTHIHTRTYTHTHIRHCIHKQIRLVSTQKNTSPACINRLHVTLTPMCVSLYVYTYDHASAHTYTRRNIHTHTTLTTLVSRSGQTNYWRPEEIQWDFGKSTRWKDSPSWQKSTMQQTLKMVT